MVRHVAGKNDYIILVYNTHPLLWAERSGQIVRLINSSLHESARILDTFYKEYFLVIYVIGKVRHSPLLLQLMAYDFLVFLKLKINIKSKIFEDMKDIKGIHRRSL